MIVLTHFALDTIEYFISGIASFSIYKVEDNFSEVLKIRSWRRSHKNESVSLIISTVHFVPEIHWYTIKGQYPVAGVGSNAIRLEQGHTRLPKYFMQGCQRISWIFLCQVHLTRTWQVVDTNWFSQVFWVILKYYHRK